MNDRTAQRLWLLEREESAVPRERAQVCRFIGAIAVLDDAAVYVVLVMSPEPKRASERALQTGELRLNLQRDGFKFTTLDEAIAWTQVQRDFWLSHGWTEAIADANDE